MPLGQAAISQVSSVLESGRLSSGDQFTAADGTAANGMEQAHILTRQKHISSSSVGSFDVIDVENLYETGSYCTYCGDYVDTIQLHGI